MTEKRYVYYADNNSIETSDGDFICYVDGVEAVKIMNALHEENEQLRFDFKEFKSLLHSLESENEQLKFDIEKLNSKKNGLQSENEILRKDCLYSNDIISKLHDENEQLKQQIADWETSFDILKQQIKRQQE